MEPFKEITDHVVPLDVDNVDTDQIIPARYMKSTQKKGLGKYLFYDWRFDAQGNPKTDFILNKPGGKPKILVVGENFGSGSSREHAPWALQDYGFRVILALSFADIFKNNALNVGLLPVQIDKDFQQKILQNPDSKLRVDLVNQKVEILDTGDSLHFEINQYKKKCLLEGINDIDYLVGIKDEIIDYEKKRQST